MESSEIFLLNQQTSQWQKAEIWDEISNEHLWMWMGSWRPLLDASAQEDAHWDWVELVHETQGQASQCVAITCQAELQGLMINTVSRAPGTVGEIVYIERLAAAPWNRLIYTDNPKFRTIGKILLAAAVWRSIRLALEGKVGLHSLPTAAGFYRRMGMVESPGDASHQHLPYFEFSSNVAKNFLNGEFPAL